MRKRMTWLGLFVALCASACGGPAGEEEPIIPDGKADGVGFDYGIYYFDGDFEYEGTVPLMVAFHNVREAIPENYAGHFDYAVFDGKTEETDYFTGVFKLYRYRGKQRILLESYDGKEIDRLDWTYADRRLAMGDQTFYRLNPSDRDEVIRECEAFQVLELEFEEGFTTWEYQSVYAEMDAAGKKEVQFGACSFDEDEAAIEFKTLPNGDFEASVTTEYDEVFVLLVPDQNPSRGEIRFGPRGGELQLMARLVCYPGTADTVPRPNGFWVPLVSENDGHLLSQHNDVIEAASKPPVPEGVFVSGDDAGRGEFSRWIDYLEELADEFGIDYAIAYATPGDYRGTRSDGTVVTLCYQGDVSAVPSGLEMLTDNVLSDQFTLVSWKHGDVVGYADWLDDLEDWNEWLRGELGADWGTRPVPGDSIEVAYTITDSGDSLDVSVIERCAGTAGE